MASTETPEERKKRLLEQLARGRETARKKREAAAKGEPVPAPEVEVYKRPPKKPRNLDKIIREILNDDEIVDQVIANQPDYWNRLPEKNGAYIIATVMMVKAMGGDIKAADWIRKSGYGDKVILDDQGGFFAKQDFTIQVIPTKASAAALEETISPKEVLEDEIKQIEDDTTRPSDS
jgi:hypothetical protein